jgi:steroid 5-alpha reductase family enzyme
VWSIISINRILTLNRLRSPSQAYSTLKAAWKNTFYINFFIRIFCVQAILQYLISLPIIITNTSADQSFGNLDFIALFVYIIGLALIVRGNDDLYLATRVFNLTDTHITKEAFINNKIYYGESCIWISIFIFALSVPYGWISIISPLVIILLLSRLPELYKPLRLIKSDLLGEQI